MESLRVAQDRLSLVRDRLDDLSFEERRDLVLALFPMKGRDGLILRANGQHELRGVLELAPVMQIHAFPVGGQ